MANHSELAEQFDRSRRHLRAVAFRMLGSTDEADDAVQETWLRASRFDARTVVNVTGWLTTIVARVCLEWLRSRQRRGEELLDLAELDRVIAHDAGAHPEADLVMAESVGLALLVVLDTLGPAERIAGIVERSPGAAKKLASRARHRVRGTPSVTAAELRAQREVIDAFLAASRAGDLEALLAVLAPDVVRRADRAALGGEEETEIRGARRVAEETLTHSGRARFARPVLVNGALGVVVAPLGRPLLVLEIELRGDRVAAFNVISNRARLRQVRLSVVDLASTWAPPA